MLKVLFCPVGKLKKEVIMKTANYIIINRECTTFRMDSFHNVLKSTLTEQERARGRYAACIQSSLHVFTAAKLQGHSDHFWLVK